MGFALMEDGIKVMGNDKNMKAIVKQFLSEEKHRTKLGDCSMIPMRPDHGHLIGNEVHGKNVNPGYSFGGRLKGLGELRGLLYALEKTENE